MRQEYVLTPRDGPSGLVQGTRQKKRWTALLGLGIWMLSMGLLAVDVCFLILSRATPNVNAWFALFVFFPYPTLGGLVTWRRSENPIAWLLSVVGLGFALLGSTLAYSLYALRAAPGRLPGGVEMAWLQDWVWWLSISLLPLVMLILPNGQLLSRRWRKVVWLAGSNCAALTFIDMFYPHTLYLFPSLNNPFAIPGEAGRIGFIVGLLVLMVTMLIALVSLLLRFRRAKGEERQQLKWIFSAFVLCTFLFIATTFLPGGQHQTIIWGDIINGIGGIAIPVALGIAILRYRLWDIDIIINRALVYGTLTVMLALVYFGLVIGLQSLVHLVTGTIAEQPLIIVASTLTIAALFQPLRRRVQTIIDSRFYRRKYDAVRTLAAFSASLRNDVDLDQLRAHLIAVVEETMQPMHGSLWVRPPEHK